MRSSSTGSLAGRLQPLGVLSSGADVAAVWGSQKFVGASPVKKQARFAGQRGGRPPLHHARTSSPPPRSPDEPPIASGSCPFVRLTVIPEVILLNYKVIEL